MGQDPDAADNEWLREAYENQISVIYFLGIAPGRYIIMAAVLIVEVLYQPPYWVHAVLWVPLTGVLCLGLLRPFKATLVALQYRHKAQEGRLAKG